MITSIGPASVSPFAPIAPPIQPKIPGQGAEGGESFSDLLSGVVKGANMDQAKADEGVKKLVTGENIDIHQVMLQMEQARLSLMMVVDVRNKMVEAYQELSRMPI